MKVILLTVVLSLGSLWIFQRAQAAAAKRFIVGGNFTLENGETLREDLMIVGGLVTLEYGSILNGDILMVGGSMEAAGKVNGDIVVAGGLLNLKATAMVDGDITTAGANLQQDPAAIVTGEIITEQEGPIILSPTGIRMPQMNMMLDPAFSFVGYLLRVVLWALLAMLLALFLSSQLRNVSQTAMSQPWVSVGLGLLSVFVLPLALVIIALTILLIPASLLGLFLLVLAWVFGLVALGTELGNRFARIFKSQWHPALAAGAGTFLLMLVVYGIEAAVPCLGWLPHFMIGALGLGAVLLTRFGMRPYPAIPSPAIQEAATPGE